MNTPKPEHTTDEQINALFEMGADFEDDVFVKRSKNERAESKPVNHHEEKDHD